MPIEAKYMPLPYAGMRWFPANPTIHLRSGSAALSL